MLRAIIIVMKKHTQDVHISTAGVTLHGSLSVLDDATALVLFAQGSGSGRFSPRNKYVADAMNNAGFSTLLIDLLTPGERTVIRDRDQQSKLDWLYARLNRVVDWISAHKETANLHLALLGSNTGAVAALKIAADRPNAIKAVVSWSGRPDIILDELPKINAKVLLIAGANDETYVNSNRKAAEHFRSQCFMEIIPDAGHELKEPGKIDLLANICCTWLNKHMPR